MDLYADITLTLLRISQLQALTDATAGVPSPPPASTQGISFADELNRASAQFSSRYLRGDVRTGPDTSSV
jgi:hypothetical protein